MRWFCSNPGCKTLVGRAGRCSRCRSDSATQRMKWRENREASTFYASRAWRRLREYQITREPLCRHCMQQGRTTAGKQVDHIIPRKRAPELELDMDNVQTLCASCHCKKTMAGE